jgi:hypothetical protein
MRRLLPLLLISMSLAACAAHDRYSDRERWDDWRRQAQANPPPCPGPTWVDGRGPTPDGRFDPGRWECAGAPGYGYGGAGYGYGGAGHEGHDGRGYDNRR